jgi:hypothetical protein
MYLDVRLIRPHMAMHVSRFVLEQDISYNLIYFSKRGVFM